MSTAFIYLGIMLGVIVFWFLAFKRPIYEAVLISFIVLLTVTGTWGNIWSYIDKSLSTSLLYSMVAFVTMSIVLTKTKMIDGCVSLILSLLGKIPGGVDKVRKLNGVLNVTVMCSEGEEIPATNALERICLRIHVVGDDVSQLAKNLCEISKTLDIISVNGENMQLEPLEYERCVQAICNTTSFNL